MDKNSPMSKHPINLFIRFLLEMFTLFITGLWGWQLTESVLRFFLAIGVPLILATLWGVFAVKNDPSRSGKTVVSTPGSIRLILEISFFGFGVWALGNLGNLKASIILLIVVLLHYIFSYDRIIWLFKQ